MELLDPAKGDDDEYERNDGDENDDGEGEDTDGSDDWETTADADEVLDDPEEAEQFENVCLNLKSIFFKATCTTANHC